MLPSGPAEIADLAASFNEMAANLERLFDARRELVAWVSHDLRTLLANIQAMLEALAGRTDGSRRRRCPSLEEQTRALSTMVDDLFELAQIDAGALGLGARGGSDRRPRARPRCAASRPKRVCEAFASTPRSTTSVRARFAPFELQRVLQNLLTNALRHTPSDGSVAVRVSRRTTTRCR